MAFHVYKENRSPPVSMLFRVILMRGIPLVFGRCPVGWLEHSRSCYVLNQENTNWYEAQDICREAGGYLVRIESAEENTFIATNLRTSGESVWIGLHDNDKELNFVWVDTPQMPAYTNWDIGEPNSFQEKDEDCVHMWKAGVWNDYICTRLLPSICEKP